MRILAVRRPGGASAITREPAPGECYPAIRHA